MAWPKCNMTSEYESIQETEISGTSMTFHQLAEIISMSCTFVAVVVSLFLIIQHARHYSKPYEQRPIIRILFMVPIYAMVSCVSLFYYKHAVYFEAIRDCYEAFAIASFFTLMCHYIAPDLHAQKDYFRGIKPKPWVWPMNWLKKIWGGEKGPWRTPRSGLTWFNVIWTSVFQYCFIRVAMTIVTCITQWFGRYCEESLNPAFSHIWVMSIESLCVTIAMYCIIQFYVQLREDLAPHHPFLKVLAIKLVIFLSFWQSMLISFLTSADVLTASDTIDTPDIKIGLPSMLLCIEMSMFAILHIWAFSYRTYKIRSPKADGVEEAAAMDMDPAKPERYYGGPLGIYAYIDAFNPWDLIKAIARGVRWMFVGRRKRMQDRSYQHTNAGTEADPTTEQTPATDFPAPNVTGYDGASDGFGAPGRMQKPPYPQRYGVAGGDEGQNLLSDTQQNPISTVPINQPTTDIGLSTWKYEDGGATVAVDPTAQQHNLFTRRRQEMEDEHDEWQVTQNQDYQRRYDDMVRREAEQDRDRQLNRNPSRRHPNDPFVDQEPDSGYSPPRRNQDIYNNGIRGGGPTATTTTAPIGVGLAYPMDPPELQRQNRQTIHQQQPQQGFVQMPVPIHPGVSPQRSPYENERFLDNQQQQQQYEDGRRPRRLT